MSRYADVSKTNREKLSSDRGWSTSAPSSYSGSAAGLGSYDRSGRSGHPLNGKRGELGREHDKSPLSERTAAYQPAGPSGKGYPSNGAHTVKASPLRPKERARFA